MRTALILASLAAQPLLTGCVTEGRGAAVSPSGVAEAAVAARQRGVCWVAGREVAAADLEPLRDHHVNWISQTPFGWQERFDSPEIELVTAGRVYWGEQDRGLVATARLARQAGIETLLKPHLWLRDRAGGKWEGDIAMASEEDWRRWFASYREFLLHYARLAETEGMAGLAVGTELAGTVATREADWRRLIAEVRQVYSGFLTYAANWAEFEAVPFWDRLDYIGIQAYFPLSSSPQPTVEELVAAWEDHLPRIRRVASRYGKPVLFTEIGYRSIPGAAARPWSWPQDEPASASDLAAQAACYEAFFRTFWDEPWFAGAYIWKWYPQPSRRIDPATDFTPQDKPAARVLARWYRGDAR